MARQRGELPASFFAAPEYRGSSWARIFPGSARGLVPPAVFKTVVPGRIRLGGWVRFPCVSANNLLQQVTFISSVPGVAWASQGVHSRSEGAQRQGVWNSGGRRFESPLRRPRKRRVNFGPLWGRWSFTSRSPPSCFSVELDRLGCC